MNPEYKKIFGKKLNYQNLGLSEELISIYKKPKIYRTIKDNLYLIQKNDHLGCFQKIIKSNKEGELIYETIIKNLDFVIYEPEKVIYYPKDMIINVFYIFQGTVKVDKNQYQNFPSPVKSKKKRRNLKSNNIQLTQNIIIKESVSGEINDDDSGENDIFENAYSKNKDVRNLGFYQKLYKAVKNYQIYKENKKKKKEFDDESNEDIIILSKGEEYGINDLDLPRRLDLVETKTSCVIGFLSKHDYKYIFEKTDILKKNDIFNFLKSLKILKEVNNEVVINNIYNAINEKRIYRGEFLIKHGEESNKFFIIRKGDFQVNLNRKQKVINYFNDLNYFGHYNLKEKSKNIKYEIRNYYYNDEKYKIVTYGEGEIIGDIELYLNSNKYLTDIFCNTDSSLVYEISFDDFNINSNRTMKRLLLQEGKQKLKYFRKRIHDINLINSKKMDNINRFKEIISNKLEEEKGNLFQQIENNKSGRYKYEKKQRKKLKSASINFRLKEIINELNNKKINQKNQNSSNYFSLDKKESEEEFLVFPTSLINNINNDIHNKNNNSKLNKNKKETDSNYSQYVKTTSNTKFNKNKEKTISIFKSSKNTQFNSDNLYFNKKTLYNKNIKSSKINNVNFLSLKSESILKKNKFHLSKKFIPITLNERFQYIFTRLFINKKNRNISNDSINNINYYNTQESSIKKINDYSKNIFNTFSKNSIISPISGEKSDNRIILSPQNENKLIENKNIPFLTEIIKNKKNILFKKLSSGKHKNYNVKKDV